LSENEKGFFFAHFYVRQSPPVCVAVGVFDFDGVLFDFFHKNALLKLALRFSQHHFLARALNLLGLLPS
jgi:hypothetical protein